MLHNIARVTPANRGLFAAEALRLRLHEFDRQAAAVREVDPSANNHKFTSFIKSFQSISVGPLTAQGLAAVVPVSVISLFTPRELEVVVCGEPTVDLELLRSVAEYRGGVTKDSELVRWLWEVLEEMDQV